MNPMMLSGKKSYLSPPRKQHHQRYSIRLSFETPLRATSSSQQGSEQTHDEIDSRILQEINGCVYTDTKGFYEKYFEDTPWAQTVDKIIRAAEPRIADGQWIDYPNPPTQKAFLEWFWAFQARHLRETRSIYDTSHSTPLEGTDSKRQPDLFLLPSQTRKIPTMT